MDISDEPRTTLAAPGAGLPAGELIIARFAFAFARATLSREAALNVFTHEGSKILALAESLPPEVAGRPTLIERVFGIEDSSRNWSVWMTIEHLNIVNRQIGVMIKSLVAEKTLDYIVSTANVKPKGFGAAAEVESFRAGISEFTEKIGNLKTLTTKARHAHPWFGPLNAHGWLCLAAIHQRIHRRQIEAILRAQR